MKKFILVVAALLFSIFSVNIVFAAAFTQSDLTGTWNFQQLQTGNSNYWWRATGTINSSGLLTFSSCRDSGGGSSCAGSFPASIDENGVVTISGVNDADQHLTMAVNKKLIAGTATDTSSGTNFYIMVMQKVVPGTTYSAADFQSKSLVHHMLKVGYNARWEYGEGSTDASGNFNLASVTDIGGTETNLGEVTGFSVGSDGRVTMSFGDGMDTFEGFLSADKKTMVGTFTVDKGSGNINYRLLIIQITGQTYTAGPVSDHRSNVHMLSAGTTSLDPFWAHWKISITGGTGTTSDWVASDAGVSAPSGTFTSQLSASGTVTMTEVPSYHGQVSHDGTFTVATRTILSGTTPVGYALQVITKIPVTKNDINNDGISDMLWRNATTGQMTDWLMKSDGTRSGYKTIITNTDWTVVGTGLINRDGITDIVARQISTGQVSIWFMKSDGTRLSNRSVVTAPAWDVVGTGDFNTDGITDILVRAPSTGQVNIWFMNSNGTRASSKTVVTSTAWDVVGTGDFNVDGVTDILARAPSTGQVNIWFMKSDGTRASSKMVVTSTAWDVVGTGDFNADGIIDILARASSTGQTNIWFMNADGSRKSSKMVITALDWTPVGTGYFNADGISDIVAKSTTGKVNLWFMNGDGTRSSYKTLLDNSDWTPVP